MVDFDLWSVVASQVDFHSSDVGGAEFRFDIDRADRSNIALLFHMIFM